MSFLGSQLRFCCRQNSFMFQVGPNYEVGNQNLGSKNDFKPPTITVYFQLYLVVKLVSVPCPDLDKRKLCSYSIATGVFSMVIEYPRGSTFVTNNFSKKLLRNINFLKSNSSMKLTLYKILLSPTPYFRSKYKNKVLKSDGSPHFMVYVVLCIIFNLILL